MHGYGIAQRIHNASNDVLSVEEGSLYPALQCLLAQGVGDRGLGQDGTQSARPLLYGHPRWTETTRRRGERVPPYDEGH